MDTGNWLRSPQLHSKLLPNETTYLLDSISLYEPRLALNSCSFCFSMDYKCVPPCKALCHVQCSIYSSCFCIRNHKLWENILELLWDPWKYSCTAFKEVKAMTSSLCECQAIISRTQMYKKRTECNEEMWKTQHMWDPAPLMWHIVYNELIFLSRKSLL